MRLHDGRRYDVIHLLCHHHSLAEELSHRLVHVEHVGGHVSRGQRLPRLFHYQHLPHSLQAAHLVDEGLHDDDGHDRKQLLVVLDGVDFKHDEAFAQQVNVLLRVQQEIIAAATVILAQRRQEVVDIEVVLSDLDVTLLHLLTVHVTHVLVEGVEARHDGVVCLDHADVGRHSTAQLARFGLRDFLVFALPERQQQRHYRILLLHIEHIVIRIERVERNRMFLGVGVVDAVLSVRLTVDHGAQSRIRVSRVNQYDMGSLLVVLADDVVHEERLSAFYSS